jgi:hypothetical protein
MQDLKLLFFLTLFHLFPCESRTWEVGKYSIFNPYQHGVKCKHTMSTVMADKPRKMIKQF